MEQTKHGLIHEEEEEEEDRQIPKSSDDGI
jgi:hypothetical protein